ncbi:hypothetical protein ACFV23_42800 [Streptomyces sp. NPDC059627]
MSTVDTPTLWTYEFSGHLKPGGADCTRSGRVYVKVKLYNGTVEFSRWVRAWQDHPFIAGGAIIVDTGLLAPCTGGPNGYARAYDSTTDKWSPRVPVTVCNRYD